MEAEKIGQRVRELRTGQVLTQEQLAGRSGVTLATISRLENGAQHAPRPSTLQKLAFALEVDVRELAG